LLERAALVESGVVEAADQHVRRVREPVGAEEVLRSGGREARERILSLHAALLEVAGTAAPEHDRAVLAGADEHPADVRMRAQPRQQLRVARVELLER